MTRSINWYVCHQRRDALGPVYRRTLTITIPANQITVTDSHRDHTGTSRDVRIGREIGYDVTGLTRRTIERLIARNGALLDRITKGYWVGYDAVKGCNVWNLTDDAVDAHMDLARVFDDAKGY